MIHIDLDNNPFEVINYHVMLTDKVNGTIVYTSGKKIVAFCKVNFYNDLVIFFHNKNYKELWAMPVHSLLSDLFSRDYVKIGNI